jgi:hypothetical protein
MDKEEFHWLFGVVQGWFSAKLGSKTSSVMDPSCQHNFLGHHNSHRDITNKPLFFFPSFCPILPPVILNVA